jgi:serine/threonine protein kinase
MTGERWQRVKQIVGDALELGRDERPRFVAEMCGEDSTLQREVETLLGDDDPASGFLDLDRAPGRIGPYRVVREIGRGGMGAVYLAERDDGQFEQRVAIKVIKRGMDTDAVLRRFFAERQILARLQHPNITRLLDGGMYDSRPYFVMEYLEGRPIVEYCRERDLSIEARLRLFLQVTDAVEHAHRNLILHRDLKAGNILVDAAGAPKLLDFGIAKLLEENSEQTMLAMRPLTPQVASPEQVRGEPLTTASDVYALGVLLFQLLAGQPPYQVESPTEAEMTRVICDQPAPRPSMLAPAATARRLKGDLDNIVLKTLEKEPARRYQRAAELADDLRRYLDGRPVNARPGGAAYRLGKFMGRHKPSLAIAAVAAIAIAAAVAQAVREGHRANRRFNELRQLAGSFIFEFHDAIATLPGSTPARELVVKRALQYLDGLAREASGDVDLKRELAGGYLRVGEAQGLFSEANLGKPAEARASFEKAVALFEEVRRARPSDPRAVADLARARLDLSSTIESAGDIARALALQRQVIAEIEALGPKESLDPRIETALGTAYFGVSEANLRLNRGAEALRSRLQSIAILQDAARRDPRNAETARYLALSQKRLAYIYITQTRDFKRAAEILRSAIAIDTRLVAQQPNSSVPKMDLALDRSYLAAILQRQGDLPAARQMLESAMTLRNEVLAADPHNFRARILVISDYTKLGQWLLAEKRPAEARAAFETGARVAAGLDAEAAKNAKETLDALHRAMGRS